jgi:hypothetical protein
MMNKSLKLLAKINFATSTVIRQIHASKSINAFEGIFNSSKVAATTQAHSVLLANQQVLYDLQSKQIKSGQLYVYEKNS